MSHPKHWVTPSSEWTRGLGPRASGPARRHGRALFPAPSVVAAVHTWRFLAIRFGRAPRSDLPGSHPHGRLSGSVARQSSHRGRAVFGTIPPTRGQRTSIRAIGSFWTVPGTQLTDWSACIGRCSGAFDDPFESIRLQTAPDVTRTESPESVRQRSNPAVLLAYAQCHSRIRRVS
jgi:hypothetical protein